MEEPLIAEGIERKALYGFLIPEEEICFSREIFGETSGGSSNETSE